MKSIFQFTIFLLTLLLLTQMAGAQAVVANHLCTDITKIPLQWINIAKSNLHIAYGHTSHGSQVTDGMSGLVAFANGGGKGLSLPNNIFAWNHGGTGGALDLHDYAMGGDVGYYPDWVNNTRTYLNTPANADVNVIIWSWCGQASGKGGQTMIDEYLAPMSGLEREYPNVKFVYMTGHLDGGGSAGNLNINNQQIRDFCRDSNKVLFDFADIESYDPDGLFNYMELGANDNCDYDSNGTSRNWAQRWQNTHTENVDWYDCSAAHSQPLNGNRKAYAAWWLWARLGGWDGTSTGVEEKTKNVPENFSLLQNYPNPFNPSTKIVYTLPNEEEVEISIYNTLGQKITTLFSGISQSGRHELNFTNTGIASGVYIYQIKSNSGIKAGKMLLLK
jgi:hypothetical protein